LRAFVDTNVIVRHLTGDPPGQARRATALLGGRHELLLTDLVLAELVYVLESYYERPRGEVAMLARSLLALRSIVAMDDLLLLRAIELYESERLGFAEAYLIAAAETSGVGAVVSFDRRIDRARSIKRIEP
jgi:predicted nucleic acid-binding protein